MHTFIIVFNGESPRMTLSLKSMIRLFEKMFGNQFWNNVVIAITRYKIKKIINNLSIVLDIEIILCNLLQVFIIPNIYNI